MTLRRSRMPIDTMVSAPFVARPKGPVCLTCGQTVDREELVEGYPGATTFARVLVRHHGAEELRTFDLGSVHWDPRDLRGYMMRANWFDPRSHEGLALGERGSYERDYDDPDPTPTIIVPDTVGGGARE